MAADFSTDVMAKLLDLTPRRLQQLAAEGVLPKSERGRWPLIGCVQGYVKYLRERSIAGDAAGSDIYTTERARLTKTRADLAEMERQRLMGETILAREVEATWVALLSVMRTRLLGIGAKVAPRLKVLTSDAERKDAIDREVEAALKALSSAGIDFDPPAVAGPDGGAPHVDGRPAGADAAAEA